MNTNEAALEDTRPARTGLRRLAWLGAIVLLLIALVCFWAKPLTERVLQGVGSALGGLLQAAAATAEMAYELARQHVAQSDETKALFGEPITLAPIEQTTWLDSDEHALEFEFVVRGPKGEGKAHAVVLPGEKQFELKSIELLGPDGKVVPLAVP